ncbi:MAG TPA: hypothetical protein VNJ07_06265, partial [Chitinophagales bacterium]|nr:hypothetical protein [Chitinophagales bacterium]
TDPNGDNILLTSNASTAIPGSSFTVSGIGSNVSGHFSWTPTVADTGFHPFQVTYYDNGCPVSSPQTVTYVIYVFDRVVGGADRVYCGIPIQLNAIGGTFFTWSPASGLSNPNIPNPVASPVRPTLYTVSSDCGSDSVFVDVQPPYNLNAGKDTAICLNSLVQLSATVSPLAYAPYTFHWNPPLGLSNPDIPNPLASPLSTTTYYVTSTSAQGCIRQDTITVRISGVAPNVIAYAEPDTVCPGETIHLEINTAPTSCGISAIPCTNQPGNFTAGIGTLATGDGTPYEGYWEDGRVQYLYRATELNSLGISGGTITEIAFRIANKQSGIPYNSFTIKMGCTPVNSLSGFENVSAVVYGPVAYTTSLGWNTHMLTSPYDWDGASNLIVEVCFDNLDFTQDDDVYYTVTPFNSVAYDFDDGVSGCYLSSPAIGSNRPNTRFTVCQQSVSNATIGWTPAAGIANPASPTTTAQIFAPTTFIANLSRGGCTGQGYVTVAVDTTVTLVAAPDTSLCYPIPIQLSATPFGTPSPIQLNCGTNGTPVTASVIYSISTAAGFTGNPSPFRGSYHDGRVQMLFRKSELNALGMERGIFTSIAFHVAFKNSTQPYKEFTIKMGCTSLDVLGNSFVPGLSVVFDPKNVTTLNGWNTFNFDNHYDWDGFSNIIVEVCFDNTSSTLDDIVSYTPTTYNSVLHAFSDFAAGCNLTTASGSASRMDVRFGQSPPPAGVFTYSWSPAAGLSNATAQNPVANPAASTTYTVTVTDGVCQATDSVAISFYTNFDVNVYGTNVGCNGVFDGNAVSVPTGGVPPYNFVWSTGRTVSGVASDTLFNLYAGTYRITVTDNNGCDASDSVTITVPPPLSVNIGVRNASCYGGGNGAALAIVSGGTLPYRYLWSIGDTVPLSSQLIAGTYELTVTDISGCTAVGSATITQPPEMRSSVNVTDASCYRYIDGSATISVSGGTPPYSYLWSDSQTTPTASGLASGNYFISVTDDSNCIHIDTAIINQPDSFGITIITSDVSCFGYSDGAASASVQGDTVNYVFEWNSTPPHISPSVTGLSAGVLALTVTDTSGCRITSHVAIGSPQPLVSSVSSADITCFGLNNGIAAVNVMGGTLPYDYLWSNSMIDSAITGLSAGDYFVTVTDSSGCTITDTASISEPARIAINDSVIPVSCFGYNDGRILITVSGGMPSFSFLWSDSQVTPIAENLAAGNYSVTVTDRNGCVDSLQSIPVTQPAEILFGNIDIIPPCAGLATGEILFSANGGNPPYQFILDSRIPSPAPEFIEVAEGIHALEIIDQNG